MPLFVVELMYYWKPSNGIVRACDEEVYAMFMILYFFLILLCVHLLKPPLDLYIGPHFTEMSGEGKIQN